MVNTIYILDDIADSPASAYIEDGIIIVSAKKFDKYPIEYRFFILLHEYFHIVAKSQNEELVDYYAFQEYAQRGYSLRRLIDCMIDVLSLQLQESHRKRTTKLLLYAQEFDRKWQLNSSKK